MRRGIALPDSAQAAMNCTVHGVSHELPVLDRERNLIPVPPVELGKLDQVRCARLIGRHRTTALGDGAPQAIQVPDTRHRTTVNF